MTLEKTVVLSSYSRIVVIHNDTATASWSGETGPTLPFLTGLILAGSSADTYVAGTNLFPPLGELNHALQDDIPGWRMRITNRRRQAYARDGRVMVGGRFFPDYMAISSRHGNGHGKGKRGGTTNRWEVINLELFKDPAPTTLQGKMEMALAILEMCKARGVAFRSTKGSLATAMLRKSPKWTEGRTGAPRFINEFSRGHLPGNFYSVSAKIGAQATGHKSIPHCFYVDQSSAHHNIALSTPLPHPHHIRARGYYKAALKGSYNTWARPGTPVGDGILNGEHIGLVLCRVLIGNISPKIKHMYPEWTWKRGTRHVWLWTPELRLLQGDHRLQLETFICGFTSTERDPVLPEYAQWSLDHLAHNKTNKSYKKSTLLSAYGMLAYRGDNAKPIYRYWGGKNSRERVEIPMAGLVAESVLRMPDVQMDVVNVCARGVIESETRTRSIEYARLLTGRGLHVPQIYADGLLVETDQMPFIQEGWRISHSLKNVHIPRPNAIISDSLVKLPGVVGRDHENQEWINRREAARRPFLQVA